MIHFNDRAYKDLVLQHCYISNVRKWHTDVVEYATETGLLDRSGHLTYSGLTLAGQLMVNKKQKPSL